jgi:hypothetical protein
MADIGTLNPEQMLQQQQILRQQKMAEMLLQQGMQQPQGQMVSGRYVAPSIFQNLAGLANTYVGQRGIERAEQAQLDLAKRLRADETSAMADFFQQRKGTEGVEGGIYGPDNKLTMQTTPDMIGPQGELTSQYRRVAPVAAIPPNPLGAYANLLANPKASPRLQNMAFNKMIADPEGFTLAEGATRVERQPDGSLKVVASGGDKTSPEYKNYLLATKDPINPYKGSFVDYQTMLKKAGASSVNLPNEGERKAGFMSNILDRNILQMQTALKIDPTAVKPNVPASIVEALTGPNLLSRSMKPAQRQIVEDSQLDVLDAALTLRTGAAYTREQLNAMRDTYFPTLLDKPQAIREKKQRLESLLEGAYIMAGRAVPTRVSSPPPIEPATPTAREQLNIPKVNAPAMNSPRFLGFEPAPTGQR